ncbi:MAG: molybdenum cofactor guanylyltransferase [Desulfobacteraceae bacterium]|nr:MAG: molybdenum cofactor guanylyltransferase [Desulfobacteraceae bacterium]
MPNTADKSDPNGSIVKDTAGVILAGGKSQRFGKNKSFIPIDGTPLIEKVVNVMTSVFGHCLIVTNTPEEYAHLGLPMVQDVIKGVGPLAGILTGLKTIRHQYGFFVACDMPCLNSPFVRYLVGAKEDHDAVVPRIGRMVEPLHAIYSKTSIGPLGEVIDSGVRQVLELFSRIRVRYVEEEAIRAFDPDLRCFLNVNRPEDLARLTEESGPGAEWPRKII